MAIGDALQFGVLAELEFGDIVLYGILGIVGLFTLVFLFLFAKYIKLWIRSFFSRARIGPFRLVMMSLRKINPNIIVQVKIMAVQAGLAHAGGDAVVLMDSDMQDSPLAIRRMLDEWRQGYDVIYAIRTDRKENIVKRSLFAAFHRFLSSRASIIEVGTVTESGRKLFWFQRNKSPSNPSVTTRRIVAT